MGTDLLGVAPCFGIPLRDEPPTALEYTAAEVWIRTCYGRYFTTTRSPPMHITSQLERFIELPGGSIDPVIEVVMSQLDADFRNLFSNKIIKRYWELFRGGASNAQLLQLLKEASPGGALKPDMLGLAAGRTMEFDAIEVGTEKTAKSTYDELQYKLGLLRDEIVPILEARLLPELALRHRQRGVNLMVPTTFNVRGSAFRLGSWEKILPLPIRMNSNGTVDWICFHPSTDWKPQGAPTSSTGTDGLMLYHIHRAKRPQLPSKIRSLLDQELTRWKREKGFELELNPAYAFAQSKSDWDPVAREYVAYLGAGAVLLMCVVVASELGLLAGAAAVAEGGLAAFAKAPHLLAPAIRQSAALAAQLWPAIVPMVGYLPAKP